MTKEILIKFLENRCTNAELTEVVRWAQTGAFQTETRKWIFEDWNSFSPKDTPAEEEKFNQLFDKIQYKIDHRQIGRQHAGGLKSGVKLFTTWLTRAAAILLIPVLGYLVYTLSDKETEVDSVQYASRVVDSLEIIAPVGSRTVVQLSDGTEVHLNYGSRIRYPQFFSGDRREVFLEGEGYFDVAHNAEKPFIVKTRNLNVKALGTAFNVMAYPGDDAVETTLVTGKVVLEKQGAAEESQAVGAMEPGQHVSFDVNNGEIACSKGNIERYIGWKEGKLIFEDTPIIEITDRLSRMFNVDIEVEEEIKDYIYTVTFVDEPLFQILELMAIATPVEYYALPRKKRPDGTFTKQKIFISRRS